MMAPDPLRGRSRLEITMSCILFLSLLAALLYPTEASVKMPIHNSRHTVVRRDVRSGYFFAKNVSFGLEDAPPGTEFGPWGPWTESSECSRSCGGGIAFQDRICLDVRSDGRHTCIGATRRYFTCNTEDCPEGSNDFRSDQCARFNSVPYEGKYYSWTPYYKGENPCELNCKPQGIGFYTRLARKVTDGTRCYDDGSLNVCIDGLCMPVGCDMVLGSTAKEDECGKCNGDGTTCQVVKGIFDKDDFEVGYNDILLIPSGATSIHIKEEMASNNYLAIRNAGGEFYLNGKWRIDFPKDLKIAGTVFHYERKPHGSLAPESLRAHGPTTEPIFIVLLYQTTNMGISYEYSIPLGVTTVKPDSYSYSFGDFEECSKTCGGGVKYRPVHCVRNSDRAVVDESLCDPSVKPVINASCNIEPCPASWKIGEFSECSRPCGGGTQFRLVFCHQVKDGGHEILVNESLCEEEKPLFMRSCNEAVQCGEWVTGEWSECNKTCGFGSKTRSVECKYTEKNETLDVSFCNAASKPSEVEECTNRPCEGVEWILSEWSGCEGLCSPSMESRTAHCANEEGVVFPNKACEASRLPELTRSCSIMSICEPMWLASEWTECSVSCGEGIMTRVVFCGVWEENAVLKIDESKCVSEKKFEEIQNCSSASCDGIWFTGPWDRCSVPCGGGERHRKVLCFHENNVVNDSSCDHNEKPFEKEPCNMMPCDGDEVMGFGGCKNAEFCCPDGVTPLSEDLDFDDCPKSNISLNTTCAEAEFGCCSDGFTLAQGPFKKGCLLSISQSCNSTQDNCPGVKSFVCSNSSFGCCPDGLTAAEDENFSNCIPSDILPDTDFESSGDDSVECTEKDCCIDSVTGLIRECEDNASITDMKNCSTSEFGCCEDNITHALGPSMLGCDEGSGSEDSTIPFFLGCNDTTFGCCPDMMTAAAGENFFGCQNISIPCNTSSYEDCEESNTTLNDCIESEFGCCPDNISFALGPDSLGCNVTCLNLTFGCCPDNVTCGCAIGPNSQECDKNVTINCYDTPYGCCIDNITVALGPELEGCNGTTSDTGPPDDSFTTVEPKVDKECENTLFGCCPDSKTIAIGPNLEGCCFGLKFGCCPDNLTAALGPEYRGCSCYTYPYGCCPDGITPAQGYRYHGCRCEHFQYGCCPDNESPATGPNFEGCVMTHTQKCEETELGCCADGITPAGDGCGCIATPYGCCPDGKTTATSADLSGCPCDTLPYGCCSDGITPARTSDHRDCLCDKQRYGCCLDGRTPAKGPNFEGCPCEFTRFGCCFDGRTVAQGPDFSGCPCEATKFGCCADGFSHAEGPGKEGCPRIQLPKEKTPAEVCSMPKDVGPCRNYTVRWFFDVEYGGCSRFWYGGCSGNGNIFATEEHCEETCVAPEGADACLLPKVVGPCKSQHLSYYYDTGLKRCEPFYYGGCLGNNNRFTSKEHCEETCIVQRDVCHQPEDAGNCSNFRERWFYDSEYGKCHRFYYSGCGGNENNFPSELECEKRCEKESTSVTLSPIEDFKIEFCFLDKDMGHCSESELKYYYDRTDGVCREFVYTGCGGNGNRFNLKRECEAACDNSQDICRLPVVVGPCSGSFVQYYYDHVNDDCFEFRYSGCAGNANRFNSKADCKDKCSKNIPTAPAVVEDVCSLPSDPGPCRAYFKMWFYDKAENACKMFVYGGCEGNANRFEKMMECEEKCVEKVVTEKKALIPSLPSDKVKTNEDVCRLPVDPGPCTDAQKRWFYDSKTETCLPFVFGGCGGNKNRFKAPDICYRFCTGIKATSSDLDTMEVPLTPDTVSTTEGSVVCRHSTQTDCASINCPFGIEELYDIHGCLNCRCSNPCETHKCSEGTKCSVDFIRTPSGEAKAEIVCRKKHKLGDCPKPSSNNLVYNSVTSAGCTDHCHDDADCRGSEKCCNNGCALVCMEPTDIFIPATQPEQARILPGPNITRGLVGKPAELPCRAVGYPKPSVTWWRETTMLPFSSSRYEQLPNYSLLIRTLTYEDKGDYSCQAHNGIGQGASFTVTLIVEIYGPPNELNRQNNPPYQSSMEDSISSINLPFIPPNQEKLKSVASSDDGDKFRTYSKQDDEQLENAPLSVTISLRDSAPNAGSEFSIDCAVHGPSPEVSWFFEGTLIHSNHNREILPNNTLIVRKAETSDSGEYICSAKYGESVASSSVTVHVEGNSIDDPDCVDSRQFANCELIVLAKYCRNKYYGKYCCASCKQAGQLHDWPLD